MEVAPGRGTGQEIVFAGDVAAVRAELISTAGDVLSQSTIQNGRMVFDTAGVPEGVHFIRIQPGSVGNLSRVAPSH